MIPNYLTIQRTIFLVVVVM